MNRILQTDTLGDLIVTAVMPSIRNIVFTVKDQRGKKYVYKQFGKPKFEQDKLAEELAFLGVGIDVVKRTPKDVLELRTKVEAIGVKTPRVVEVGKDYTIEEFIEGVQLMQVTAADFEHLAKHTIEQLGLLHRNGVVLGDRWIESQIYTESHEVYFIDFDLAYQGDGQASLEIAELLNALTFERKFEEVVFVAESFNAMARQYNHNLYNLDLVVVVLKKHIAYWSDPQNVLGSLIDVLGKKTS